MFNGLSYKLSRALQSKSLPIANRCFFPGLIEHPEVVVLELDIAQVVPIHRVTLGFIDVEERDDRVHDLSA